MPSDARSPFSCRVLLLDTTKAVSALTGEGKLPTMSCSNAGSSGALRTASMREPFHASRAGSAVPRSIGVDGDPSFPSVIRYELASERDLVYVIHVRPLTRTT